MSIAVASSAGRCIHCDEMTHMERHLLEKHHYQIDLHRTVLYGLCEKCLEEGEEETR